jgi:hypothetical protein
MELSSKAVLKKTFTYLLGMFVQMYVQISLYQRKLYLVLSTVDCTLKKNYGTHVIKLDIAPVAYPLGQHLFISASNNMFYRHSQ